MISDFMYMFDLESSGESYMYNFLLDYEAFIRFADVYVPMQHVLRLWTCIPPAHFVNLRQGDTFYLGPTKMICVAHAYKREEDGLWMVTAEEFQKIGADSIIVASGEAYSQPSPWDIQPQEYVQILRERGELSDRKDTKCLKPLLITKTSQATS